MSQNWDAGILVRQPLFRFVETKNDTKILAILIAYPVSNGDKKKCSMLDRKGENMKKLIIASHLLIFIFNWL